MGKKSKRSKAAKARWENKAANEATRSTVVSNISDNVNSVDLLPEPDVLSTVDNTTQVQEPVYTCCASYSQGHAKYSAVSRGYQCTCNSLMFHVMHSDLNRIQMLQTQDLNRLLDAGDQLYRNVRDNLIQQNRFDNSLLSLDELPSEFQVDNTTFRMEAISTIIGPLCHEDDENGSQSVPKLATALQCLEFLRNLRTLLDVITRATQECIIVTGDINEDQLSQNNKPILNLMTSYGFEQVIQSPTTENRTLLDVIFVSPGNVLHKAGVVQSYYGYHDPVFCVVA